MSLFSIDHHVYFHGDSQQTGALALIIEKQNLIISKLDQVMATSQERYDAIMARLDTVTNDIAADYKKLLEEARTKTVSDESLAKGETNVLRLEALGASVENPVPELPGEGTPNP